MASACTVSKYSGDWSGSGACSLLQIAVKAGLPIMLPSWVGHIWDTATLTDCVFHATDGNMVRQGEGRGGGKVGFEGKKDKGMGR